MNGTESKGRKIWVLILIDHELAWNDELYPSNRIVMQLTPNCFYSLEKAKFCFSHTYSNDISLITHKKWLAQKYYTYLYSLLLSFSQTVDLQKFYQCCHQQGFICCSKYFSNWCNRLSDPTRYPWSKLPSMANNICM